VNDVETKQVARAGGTGLRKVLYSFQEMLHNDLSRNRFAEEREWYESALFYQRRQWLKWDNSNKRWSVVKQDPDKPRPMPVTNHFARTINANANQLAGGNPRVQVTPNDDSDKNRRGAQYAERAIQAIDEESGFNIQRPLLGKHTALWGIGVTIDIWDSSKSNGVTKIPQIEIQSTPKLGCIDCGQVADLSPEMSTAQPVGPGDLAQANGVPDNAGAQLPGQGEAPCPSCGSMQTMGWMAQQPVTTEVKEFSKGRICTEVRPIFEFFIPRDAIHPNLSKKLQRRYRKPLSEAKRLWPDQADDLKADEKQDVHEIYMEALRSLVNYNYMHDQATDGLTITETWIDFDQLPDNVQELLTQACETGQDDEGEPVEYPDEELDPVEQLEQWGIYIVAGGGKVLDWGINNVEGEKPPTFYIWDVDPASVYPKSLGSDLVPLQKRLNRLDSLMELGMMSNAAGKWLWPTTQTTKPPTGSPSDVVEFDPIGDGKIAPTFVQPSPFHQACWNLRAAIKQDFMEIGMTESINQGQNPSGVTAFRGLAYLGAKSAEQFSTPRQNWERALACRHKKNLILAKRNWNEERKVRVAGFNGRYGMQAMTGADLEGDYSIEIVEGSSRPKTFDEKQQDVAMLLQGGLLDPTDSATREYIFDQVNLDGVNMVDHLQYLKAERDLDMVIAGNIPAPNKYANPQIFLKVFSNFTFTEEFDALPPDAQQRVDMACDFFAQMIQQAQAAAAEQQLRAQMALKVGTAMAGRREKSGKAGNTALEGVPGSTTSPEASAAGANQEANQVAAQLP